MQSAFAGLTNIKGYVEQARSRISIMPGAGINESNVVEIAHTSGAHEFHMSLRSDNAHSVMMESKGVHFGFAELSGERVKKVRSILNRFYDEDTK